MMPFDLYSIVKTVHIIGATILFGTGLGIAFFFFSAHRNGGELAARLFAARTTVIADFAFTLPAAIAQPLTGIWLIYLAGLRGTEAWLVATYALYIVAGLCWLPVVWIQIRLRTMLRHAQATGTPPPDSYRRLYRWWFALGWPAFIGLTIVFFLMVLKPTW
jgi:uncharacterized membrane protein